MELERVIALLPEWRCHKIVHGGKIIGIKFNVDDSATLLLQINPSDPPDESVSVLMDDSWMLKHKPEVGGYFVVYDGGYTSYSPKNAFESGYSLR